MRPFPVPPTRRALARLASSLALIAALAAPAAAGPAVTATVPLADPAAGRWDFFGDHVVRTTLNRSGTEMNGRFEGFAFDGGKALWTHDALVGGTFTDLSGHCFATPGTGLLCAGNGPLVTLDTELGNLRALDYMTVGLVDMGSVIRLPGNRLLVLGTQPEKAFEKALEHPRVLLVDAASGKLVWSHDVTPYVYDVALGFWQRVQAYDNLNPGAAKKTKYQLAIYAVGHGANGAMVSSGPDADQVLVVGEKLEALSLADGHRLWIAPEKTGIVRNVAGRVAYMRHKDELGAYDIGTGAKLWTMDLLKKGATIYGPDDLEEKNMHGPKDMDFVLVSEKAQVSRVDPVTGQAKWSVDRNESSWQATESALLVEGKDRTTAYDWATGKPRWEFKGGRLPHAYGDGPVLLFVERGEKKNGQFVGPFKVWAVNAADGRVAWSKEDLDGRKILGWTLTDENLVRLVPDKGDTRLFSLESGEAAAAGADEHAGTRRWVYYSRDGKYLSCSDYSGNRVWMREAEMSSGFHYKLVGDQVIWAAKDGTVEVIGLQDGATRWKTDAAGKDPRVWLDDARTRMVVPTADGAAFVKL